MLKLTVTNGPDRGKSLDLETGKSYVIGCNEDADLFLSDPMVLKSHCVVTAGQDHAVIRNNTANAGTFVGDKKISQAKIRGNTSFRLGESTVKMTITAGPDPLLGKIIKGYKLNEVVGEGGMGKVYRATQLSLHRDVALKVLREALAKDKSFRDLFVHEARAAAQLVHPNVVQVYDAGSEGDVVFFSMEFIGRGSVEEILADGPIPWEEAILMVLEAAHGLEYAEGKGIVHRDIKPDNLMINADGRVKIADLGLAKRGEGKKDQGIIGTPHFIPPEQALGKDVDTRADLYSLGATFFRMITGKTLFTGKTAKEIVLKHIKEPPPAASSINKDVPDDLEVVLATMLRKDPDQRYQTATECIKALEEVCAHHGIKGSIIRKGVGKRVLIPVILLLLGAVGAAIYFGMQDPVQLVDEKSKLLAQKAEQERLKAQEEARRKAQETRSANAKFQLGELENAELRLQADSPAKSTYDDPKEAPDLERRWKERAKAYEDFAKTDDATEFGFAEKANQKAQTIRKTLDNAQKAAGDKQAKIKAKLAEVKKIDEGLRDTLTKLKSSDQWEAAFKLCALVSAEEPGKSDPFAPVATWVWQNPFDATDTQKATEISLIVKAIDSSRKHFKSEGGRIERQAGNRWDEIKKSADALDPIGQASDAQIQAVIDTLEGVVKNFPDDGPGVPVPDIRKCASDADKLARKLEKELRDRQKARIMEDRALVANAQRKRSSLDPDQLPNQVMHCEFASAINEWTKTLEDLKTPRYQAFVEERIAMLRWCEYLLAKFHLDSRDPDQNFTTDDLLLPLPDGDRDKDTALSKPTDNANEFTTKYRYKRKNTWKLESFPMDWIYHALFHHKGKPRWKEVTPALRFALGAFAFETMQYKRAKEQFDALAADDSPGAERYQKVASALAVRSELERHARADWEAICAALNTVKTADQAKQLAKRANDFYKQHEGTIFYLDVKPRERVLGKDFYEDAKAPEIPKAPPPP